RATLESRWNAEKPLAKSKAMGSDLESLAGEVLRAHKHATRTIIVVNTVQRACDLFGALKSANSGDRKKESTRRRTQNLVEDGGPPSAATPGIVLLHSRFR